MGKKELEKTESDFAIIRSGGKQYLVKEGVTILVDRLPIDAKKNVDFESLLTCKNGKISLGFPVLKRKIKGKVLAEIKDKKIRVFKYKPKKRYRKKIGFRAVKTKVEIIKI